LSVSVQRLKRWDQLKNRVDESASLALLAQGEGPSNWAQWPIGEVLCDEHFFGQAGDKFRRELRKRLKWPARQGKGDRPIGPPSGNHGTKD
jgi:hypothetical protein